MHPTTLGTPTARTYALRAWVAACYVLTLLVLLPMQPGMPVATVDASASALVNFAVANQLRFGTDIVSALGPLGSALTHQYSPETDALMLLASWVFATAIFVGFAILALPGRFAWLLLVPVVLSQIASREALFMVLPLMLLLAAERDTWTRWHRVAVHVIGGACAMLPLVLGSLAVPVALCSVLAVLALWERSPRDAVVLVAVQLAALLAGWLVSGQSWPDLPRYFTSQWSLLGGYAGAMGSTGPMEEILAFLGVALVLVCAAWFAVALPNGRIVIATIAVLFLCFKAAFVRHDDHALIAAGVLLLVGFLLVVQRLSVVSGLALLASLAGWAAITGNHEAMEPLARVDRLASTIAEAGGGLAARVFDPDRLPAAYRLANEGIAKREPLPRAAGKADLYPSNVAVLLANGGRWAPRPVPQSRMVSTPALAAMNETHLRWGGSQRIYFGLDAAEGRYPAMQDGGSWPLLLANYEPAGIAGGYAVLNRRPTSSRVQIGAPLFEGTRTMGGQVAIPAGAPVWAQIDLAPTTLGKLAAALFKLPELTLSVRYGDHSRKVYRFVPGQAQGGFLLSPTITTPDDFVALQSPYAQDLLARKVPVSFALHGASGTSLLWKRTFTLRMAPLRIEAAPGAGEAPLGPQATAAAGTAPARP